MVYVVSHFGHMDTEAKATVWGGWGTVCWKHPEWSVLGMKS